MSYEESIWRTDGEDELPVVLLSEKHNRFQLIS